jgi:hypothetical protein
MEPRRRTTPSPWDRTAKANAGETGRPDEGNVLILSLLLVTLLVALASAHFMTVQKNTHQSAFFGHLGALRAHGESGVHMALYEMAYKTGGGDGNIGTETWSAASDVGGDGVAGTGDEGEADGAPTPGEPAAFPVAIGPLGRGAGLLVNTTGTAWPDVKRILSVASDPYATSIQEVHAREAFHTVPGVGAIFVQPGIAVDVNGNSFSVTGTDTNPGGSPGAGAPVMGIATDIGDPAGSNATTITTQIPTHFQDQVAGAGGTPSVAETDKIDFEQVWSWLSTAPKTVVLPGTYSDGTWGSAAANDYRVTCCKGDLELSGDLVGAGILMVDGNVTFSGHSEFSGIVIVRGDTTLTGGGSGVHVYGSLLVGKSADDADPTLTISGNTKMAFSSLALSNACKLIPPTYTILSWKVVRG